jgi:hypothetical protein
MSYYNETFLPYGTDSSKYPFYQEQLTLFKNTSPQENTLEKKVVNLNEKKEEHRKAIIKLF